VLKVLLFLLPAVLLADNWTAFRYGPFEVLTENKEKEARETLNYLEQLRHVTATLVGAREIQTVWPVRVVVVDGKRGKTYPTLGLARDAWVASVTAMTPEATASVVNVLLDSWTGHVPPNIERGLISLLATLDVSGTHVTLGTPPAQKDRDWSRAHMLAVHPDYSGKLRVLLGNLGKGVDGDVAYRNAFEKSAEEIERALDQYIEAGKYDTVPASGKPISARTQLLPKQVPAAVGELALADVLLAHAPNAAAQAYQSILRSTPDSVEAREGLGLVAAAEDRTAEASKDLAQAKSARALVVRAALTKDGAEKKTLLSSAAKANPRWAEPHRQLAALETHPAQRLVALRAATALEPRDSATWIALAETQEANRQFAEAAKSWTAAERATDDLTARAQIRQARGASENRRVEEQIEARNAERRRIEQELQDLRNRALTDIRKAEARANEGKPVIDASTLGEYKEDLNRATISGMLTRVDCLGEQARLHVSSGRQVTRILVPVANQVEITGGGERSLGCGVQKPARKVSVDYTPRTNQKQGTAGEAAKIEFR
jgi:hypothetical protein